MPFESLAARHEVEVPDFPPEWLPLTYLYDPDLPLFPIFYFHALDPDLPVGQRPSFRDRVFGFVQNVNMHPQGATIGVVLNKDLGHPANAKYVPVVEQLVRQRLGLGDPITPQDVINHLSGALGSANQVMEELWHQVVAPAFGNRLPFGSNWDAVFGLVRFIASWNSGGGGRKGELIQTHFFMSAFGERITAGNQVNADYYLLPTLDELQDLGNPLNLFPTFSELVSGAADFVAKYCDQVSVGPDAFSAFNRLGAIGNRKLETKTVLEVINRETGSRRNALFENYGAFNRGPQRSIIALMMIHDLRTRSWNPTALTPQSCAAMYKALRGTYQTPKVLQLYAQQCFGASSALPIDNWVETFVRWPLGFSCRPRDWHDQLFACSDVWGKLERLIWVAAQARKVHSSVCAETLWCIRYGGPDKAMRGANPLSCKICLQNVRAVCPAYAAIKDNEIVFNEPASGDQFSISTTAGDDTSPNQSFVSVSGPEVLDEYSARDRPEKFKAYPQPNVHDGPLTVDGFVSTF